MGCRLLALASLVALVASAAPLGPAACSDAAAGDSIAPAALAGRLAGADPPLVLDVRTPEEFARGRVPGAVNVPHTELAARVGELAAAKDRELVVYCERGPRASAAESILREAGFARVTRLDGHMRRWRASDLPCEGC
jgi:rhodanese-related sulfurtransferase